MDAVVIGSGPNGLAAAITIARAGRSVRVYEARDTPGGGLRSAMLTDPGCIHDVCATVLGMAEVSPFFRSVPLAELGFRLAHPEIPLAHPFDDGSAVVLDRAISRTEASLDAADRAAYRRVFAPLVNRADVLMPALLSLPGLGHPVMMARFAWRGVRSANGVARGMFRGARARALFAGLAAHSLVPLEFAGTAGYAIALGVAAHAVGWPVAEGGSQRLADALVSYLQSLGGEVVTGKPIRSLADLPASQAVLADVTPRQLLALAGDAAARAPRLARYRYGPGVFKLDWALSAPVPWRAADCRRAGTIHLGGTLDEIAASERESWAGRTSDRPFVIVVQPSVFDPQRAPAGRHTLWAYCHVPHGSSTDMTTAIEAQIERFAPGFREVVTARHAMGPAELERGNANLVGGDIAGGAADLRQVLARPVLSVNPYATPFPGVFLCSSSTPPGIGVHGMCGVRAARAALRLYP
jgi:phytoene dehydrogenase-like protein